MPTEKRKEKIALASMAIHSILELYFEKSPQWLPLRLSLGIGTSLYSFYFCGQQLFWMGRAD
jgi:hypothetical protein